MDADIFISLTHFKGHEAMGIGGAVKNTGMGCGSRAGKMEMHSAGKPYVHAEKCVGCGACVRICAHDAPKVTNGKAAIDHAKCVGCGRCIGVCPTDAVTAPNDESNHILNKKIVEVNLKNNVKLPEKDGIKLIKGKNTLYKIEVDMNKTTMDELLGMFKADDIQDITISSTPLEEIIKNIMFFEIFSLSSRRILYEIHERMYIWVITKLESYLNSIEML
mgnify:CR=1 FL=1